MKLTAVTAAFITALASTAGAAPLETRQYGIFGLPGSLFGGAADVAADIFGTGVCIFGTIVSGGSRLCIKSNKKGGGDGAGLLTSESSSSTSSSSSSSNSNSNSNSNIKENVKDNGYNFSYKTKDDKYEITITPNDKSKKECDYTYDKDGDIKALIAKAADKCLE